MFKMLIVEDERWEREGLIEFLDWASMGISVIETASDGIEGLDKALEIRPDIIITDIQMPGRNGIEMAKLVLEQLPGVRIVVLTGYDDFEFAREALRFGAVDYVLKPVGEEEMLSTMLKVVQGCEDQLLKRSEEERMWLEKDAMHHLSLRQQVMDWLLGRGGAEAQQQTINELRDNGYLEAGAFSVWLCSRPGLPPKPDTMEMERTAGTVLGRQVLVLSAGAGAGQGELAAFVLLIALQQDELSGQAQLAEKLLQVLNLQPVIMEDTAREQVDPAGWIIGISSPREDIGLIRESFRESQSAFNFAVFNGLSGVVAADGEQLARKQFTKDSEVFTRQFRELAKRLRYDLGSGSPTGPVMDGLFALLAAHPGAGKSYIASLLGGVIESCSSLAMPAAQATTAVAANHMEALLASSRLPDMRAYTAGVIGEMSLLLEEKRNRKDDYLINRVIVLIEEQYGNQDLSLAYLAGEVFVSPNHLGMIFKKKTGKTPSEYIQEYRLARAEEMLRTTKQRIAIVAEQIGIPNPSYFGLLYKQVYGMTPGEYREFVQR
ncbi:response regulator transcription factor [Paenibacillus phytohabitans]|uniref:response regulator transcription factor n=1 Tax=Paenibacillus phytohabitans TaxID=2654978 RepID=UPI0030097E21